MYPFSFVFFFIKQRKLASTGDKSQLTKVSTFQKSYFYIIYVSLSTFKFNGGLGVGEGGTSQQVGFPRGPFDLSASNYYAGQKISGPGPSLNNQSVAPNHMLPRVDK